MKEEKKTVQMSCLCGPERWMWVVLTHYMVVVHKGPEEFIFNTGFISMDRRIKRINPHIYFSRLAALGTLYAFRLVSRRSLR